MVDDRTVGRIGTGLLVLLGVARSDTKLEADWLIDKVLDLRVFENDAGKFDRSLRDVGGELMVVSQFTLLADTGKGRRPSFTEAATPEYAVPLYEHVVSRAASQGVRTATGELGAHMTVELVNDGPVTILLDSATR
jgi:D-tyrosyl-tRNA(Tyr) deacylase